VNIVQRYRPVPLLVTESMTHTSV